MKKMLRLLLAVLMVVPLVGQSEAFAKGSSSSGGSRSFSSGSSGGSFGRSSSSSSSGGFFKSSPPASLPSPKFTPPPSRPATPTPSSAPSRASSSSQSASSAKTTENKNYFSKESTSAVPGYDKKALEAKRHADSAKAYQESIAKKEASTAKEKVGNVYKLDEARTSRSQTATPPPQVAVKPKDNVQSINTARVARERKAEELSAKIARGNYRDRESRAQVVYGPSYYTQPAPSYYGGGYNDSYGNPYFWQWLMSRDSVERDRFIYHHRDDIDPRRMQEIKSAFPDLATSVDRYVEQKIPVNKGYVPAGMVGNEDLIYGDDVLKHATSKASEIKGVGWFFVALLAVGLIFACYYLLFVARWKVRV